MSLAPVQISGSPEEKIDPVPSNIEAERALLGALLVNNDIFDRVADLVNRQHFYDPLHGRVYDLIAQRIQNNALASAITIKSFLQDDAAYQQAGGDKYLVQLADSAVAISAARDYAEMIRDAAIRRELINIGDEITVRARKIEVNANPEDLITSAEQNLYKLAERGSHQKGFQSFVSAMKDAVEVAAKAYKRDGALSGISTGLIDLDAKLGGLHPSDLIILAGRPSMGKTSLVTNVAFNIAKAYGSERENEGGVVGFFSLEMSAEQLAMRILSDAASIPSHKLRTGNVEESEFRRFVEATQVLENAPLYIDDTPALPISAVAARARRLKRQHGLDVLIVDYLQLLQGTGGASESRVNEVSQITQGLKAIAKELNIPVIALSQLSRQVESREDKRPQLSDLRESGSIEQDADVVMFVYREEYYVEREKPSEDDPKFAEWQEKMTRAHGKAETIIGKQRHGPIGTVELSFEGEFTRFGNLARERQRPDYF